MSVLRDQSTIVDMIDEVAEWNQRQGMRVLRRRRAPTLNPARFRQQASHATVTSSLITKTLRDLIYRVLKQSGTSILSVEWLEKKHLDLVYW